MVTISKNSFYVGKNGMRLLTLIVMIFTLSSLGAETYNDWSLHSDWLWWKFRRSGLDYALVNKDGSTADIFDGKIKRIEPCHDSGLRVAFFRDCYCGWSYGFRYTTIHASGRDKVLDSSDVFSIRLHPDLGAVNSGTYAQSQYSANVNLFDIETGFRFRPECINLMLTPFATARIALVDQNVRSIYDPNAPISTSAIKANESLEMDAYGLLAGMEVRREFCWGFSFVGRLGTGLALADFKSKFVQRSNGNGDNFGTLEANPQKKQWLVIPSSELSFGIQCGYRHHNCVDLILRVGYEMIHWSNLPDFLNFADDDDPAHLVRNGSSLGFDGLFVQFHAAF